MPLERAAMSYYFAVTFGRRIPSQMKSTSIFCCFSALALSAHATIIFDNGLADHGTARINDPKLQADYGDFIRYADDFSLSASAKLGGISWYGEYEYNFPPAPPLAEESFEFSIFKKTTEVVNVATIFAPVASRVESGAAFDHQGTLYGYTAILPDLQLGAGQYILTISAGPHTEPYYWAWASSKPSDADHISYVHFAPTGDWISDNVEYAFTLYDGPPPDAIPSPPSPVPESSMVGLTGAGLLMLLLSGRIVKRREMRVRGEG